MADKKVSQETDLGLAGIDGTVEYRVIKSGGTYKQKYSDLFSYINSHAGIPTLQQVLDNNHNLTNGIVQIGTNAGGASPSTNQIAIGGDALSGSSSQNSVGVGFGALKNSSGTKNTAFGWYAGLNYAGDTGGSTFLGNNSGVSSASDATTFIGTAGNNSKGRLNIFIGESSGDYSGYSLSFPDMAAHNIFAGAFSGGTNGAAYNLGSYNIALGYQALYANDSIDRNNIIALGQEAGLSIGHALPGGTRSIYIGQESGKNSGGNDTIALGYKAGLNSNANSLVAIGQNAGQDSSGGASIAIGGGAIQNNTQINVIGIGTAAGLNNQGPNSMFIGTNAGYSSGGSGNSGNNLIAIGNNAAIDNTGNENIAIGEYSLNNYNNGITTGAAVAIGYAAASDLVSTNSNLIAIGNNAATAANPGDNSIAIGSEALRESAIDYSIGIGYQAGFGASGGNNNIAIGQAALKNHVGDTTIALGHAAGNGNQASGQFIIANESLPDFFGQAAAASFYGSVTLAAGCSYLYYDSKDEVIRAWRT